jgi:type IV secretory pathway VirB10-like protein
MGILVFGRSTAFLVGWQRFAFDLIRVTVESSRNTSLTLLFSSFECVVQGNGATEDCCSKCWREMMKKQGDVDAAAAQQQKKKPLAPAAPKESAPEPMDVEPEAPPAQPATEPAAAAAPTASAAPASTSSQTKKKKASYKNMMASMMKQQSMERDLEKEKEALRKVTGGGAFSKIDKI